MEYNGLSHRLKELRNQRGVTQKQAAEGIGMVQATLSKYESGEQTPGASILPDIANYYGVSCDYLLGLTECSSVKPDIQITAKTTGLTEKALSKLINQKLVSSSATDILLSSDSWEELTLPVLTLYKYKTGDTSELSEKELLMLKDEIMIQMYKCEVAFRHILESLGNGGADNGKHNPSKE